MICKNGLYQKLVDKINGKEEKEMVPRELFERELTELMDQIEEMSAMIKTDYRNLNEAIQIKDEESIRIIIENNKSFYKMKKQIEDQCLKVITKQQPVATDLRMVSSVLKIVSDMERVGDHAGDIGELILRNGIQELDLFSVHIKGMINAAIELFSNAIDAFLHSDSMAAKQAIEDDDIVDELFNKVKVDIINGLKKESGKEDEYIDMLMLAKYLEKIGDHGVNIAKWQLFRANGEMM